MLRAYVYRNNKHIFTLAGGDTTAIRDGQLSIRISNADELTLNLTPDSDVQPFDVVALYDYANMDSIGTLFGKFKVHRTERAMDSNGHEVLRITAQPLATYYLAMTGIPSGSFFQTATLLQGLLAMQQLVSALNPQASIDFGLINAEPDMTWSKMTLPKMVKRFVKVQTTNSKGKKVYKRVSSGSVRSYKLSVPNIQTCLEALPQLVTPSGTRWRCRPDYDGMGIEIGMFGEDSGVTVRVAPQQIAIERLDLYQAAQCTQQIDVADSINSMFVEGGNWTDNNGVSSALIFWKNNLTPAGFNITFDTYPNGMGYFRLDKLFDYDGNPPTELRSRRVVFSNIVPQKSNPLWTSPSGGDVTAAAQDLADAAAEYLTDLNQPTYTWQVIVPGSLYPDATVGDTVRFVNISADGTVRYNDDVYVVSITVIWDQTGKLYTQLELSTRLTSLLDARDAVYTVIPESTRAQTAIIEPPYTATQSCSGSPPTGTYTFSHFYPVPPEIDITGVDSGQTATISYEDAYTVIFTASGSCTVTFTVTVIQPAYATLP